MVHDIFTEYACCIIRDMKCEGKIDGNILVTARWILKQLSDNLKHRIVFICKVRSCGIVIYQPNSDLLSIVPKLLWKIRDLETKSFNLFL